MSPENKDKSIRITLDDLANINLPEMGEAAAVSSPTSGAKVYGSVSQASDPQTQKKAVFCCKAGFISERQVCSAQ
jgi:hypothetical protein